MERSGARIVPQLSLDLWGELFRSPKPHVVILFSHWGKDAVEMGGTFASVPEIVRQIPPGTAKVVDLTVCRCQPLVDTLVKKRPGCLVRWTLKGNEVGGAKLDPVLWLGLLRTLFLLLKRGPKTYPEAWDELVNGAKGHLSRR